MFILYGKLKSFLKFIINAVKAYIFAFTRLIPLVSKFTDFPKGYYTLSSDYWQKCLNEKDKANEVFFSSFYSSSISERTLPKSIYPKVHWKFEVDKIKNEPETFIISISNGKVFGDSGTVITSDNKLLFDVSLQFGIGRDVSKIKYHNAFNRLKLPPCFKGNGVFAVLATAGAEGYFHWLTDALPRIEIIRTCFPGGLETIDKFIVNEGLPIIVETLKLLNIPQDKLFFSNSNFCFEAARLVVPSLPGDSGNPPTWVCNFLRDTFLKYSDLSKGIQRIYISREKAKYRKVINEFEVVQLLSKFGFETIYLEDYSFVDQISILSNAEVVIAPHGSGLTNLMWCKPGSSILELFPPNYVNVCFWAIANEISLKYFYLIGKGSSTQDYIDLHLGSQDILVCLRELDETLMMLFESN